MNKFFPILAIGFVLVAVVYAQDDPTTKPTPVDKCGDLNAIIDNVNKVIANVSKVANQALKNALKILQEVLDQLKKVLTDLSGMSEETAKTEIKGILNKLFGAIQGVLQVILPSLLSLFNSAEVKSELIGFLKNLTGSLKPVLDLVNCIVKEILGAAGGFVTNITSTVMSLLNTLLRSLTGGIGGLSDLIWSLTNILSIKLF